MEICNKCGERIPREPESFGSDVDEILCKSCEEKLLLCEE